jgi:hypothetical protein
MIKNSSDLPEDVGTVFVTNVPGAPFQLLGRRHDGELYVGSLIFPGPGRDVCEDTREIAIEMKGIEVVTGREAEQLIVDMYRTKSPSWLAEQQKRAAEHHAARAADVASSSTH